MAVASVLGTATRAGTELKEAWKKVQGPVLDGFQSETEEVGLIKSAKIPRNKINISAREITSPVNVRRATHAAAIAEGAYEARPITAGMAEVTYTWTNYNIRFSTSLTTKFLRALGQDNKTIDQMKYQVMKAVEGLSDTVGRDFYGFSTGYWCQTSTNATQASGTYTLTNLYGVSGLGTTAQLGSLFVDGDWVALIRSAALVTNAIGEVTAVTAATPSIDVTWNGSVDSDANDYVVLAMSVGNTAIGDTTYNKALVGLNDAATTASVHGLSSSSEPLWAAGYSDTGGGRFSPIKLRKAKQGVKNNGGGKIDLLFMDEGVDNDLFSSQSAALRFADPNNLQVDGKNTEPGITFFYSRKVPSTEVFGIDRSNSVKHFSLLDYPDESAMDWSEGDKMENQNAAAFSIDFPFALTWQNRGNLAYFKGLAVQ